MAASILPLLVVPQTGWVWVVYAVAFFQSCAGIFNEPAENSLYRSGLLMSQCLHRLHPPGVTGEPFEECWLFPVGHKRPGERLLQ